MAIGSVGDGWSRTPDWTVPHAVDTWPHLTAFDVGIDIHTVTFKADLAIFDPKKGSWGPLVGGKLRDRAPRCLFTIEVGFDANCLTIQDTQTSRTSPAAIAEFHAQNLPDCT